MLETAETTLFRAVANGGDPYVGYINRFFQTEFPTTAEISKPDMLEALTTVIINTNNIRFGPKPSIEGQAAIREVLRNHIALGEPIPILIPWGGRKTLANRGVDVAEAVALKQLNCLQLSVKKYYSPGLTINIRIEDTGALYLYQGEGPEGEAAVERYSSEFQKLVRVLNLSFINPVRESTLMTTEEYFRVSNEILEPMFGFIAETNAMEVPHSKNYEKLLTLGWKGLIPMEQREYYWKRYSTQHPGLSTYDATYKLSQYFAGSLARYKLGGTAAPKAINGKYIRLMFVPPVPGAPPSLASRDISYRTIPEKISRNHMPAWRSKGYFKITEEAAEPRLASFHEDLYLNTRTTTLSRAGEEVTIQTDYLLGK